MLTKTYTSQLKYSPFSLSQALAFPGVPIGQGQILFHLQQNDLGYWRVIENCMIKRVYSQQVVWIQIAMNINCMKEISEKGGINFVLT